MLIQTARNIFKKYKSSNEEIEVLRGLNMEIEKGEITAITGESGSGKSTLLHILGLLDRPDSGKIFFNNKELYEDKTKLESFRNKKIGFVFQFHYLLNDFTAEENIAMPMILRTKDFTASIDKARFLLKKFSVLQRKDHYPSQLSGGEQQRVAVARALINDPEIVLADEPTGNLDPVHSKEIIDLLFHLNKSIEQTIVVVTHNNEIAKSFQKHYLLKNGILNRIS